MLYTKGVFSPIEISDGIRISVMSRHTLDDGITYDPRKDPEKVPGVYQEWKKELAPPDRLVGDRYKRGLSWEEFERRYLAHIRTQEIIPEVTSLARRALSEDITLLCVEESPEECHRRLLAEECLRYEPRLRLEHH
jgi:uncharacterized protein YeaO (DUF488 family)